MGHVIAQILLCIKSLVFDFLSQATALNDCAIVLLIDFKRTEINKISYSGLVFGPRWFFLPTFYPMDSVITIRDMADPNVVFGDSPLVITFILCIILRNFDERFYFCPYAAQIPFFESYNIWERFKRNLKLYYNILVPRITEKKRRHTVAC